MFATLNQNLADLGIRNESDFQRFGMTATKDGKMFSLEDPIGRTKLPWQDNATIGRCVDYALTKRSLLMEFGWPADALLLAVVALPNGKAHAVLLVKTDREDIVLDNLVDGINRRAEKLSFRGA